MSGNVSFTHHLLIFTLGDSKVKFTIPMWKVFKKFSMFSPCCAFSVIIMLCSTVVKLYFNVRGFAGSNPGEV